MQHTLFKKLVTGTVGFALLFSFAIPQRAHALFGIGDIVIDPTNLVQNVISAGAAAATNTLEYVLDGLAWQVANLAIQSMTKSIVTWINSGFEGSPAFVTDLRTNLRGVGDAVANRFFQELSNQEIATTPFQDKVLDAVRLGYYLRTSPESFYTRYPYTLNQVSPDARAFLEGDFSQGGWDAWFSTVMNPQNNPFGAQELANEALENAVAGATGDRLEELSWNRGFLSWRGKCTSPAPEGSATNLSGEDSCLGYEIRTPGTAIMDSLNKVKNVPFDRLVSADEFNEIIGALLNQLALAILGGGEGGGGVRSLTQPGAGGGGTFFDRNTEDRDTSSLSNNFAATITRQIDQVIAFQAAWERIRGAAAAAQTRCESGTPSPGPILARSTDMLTKAANSLAILREIESDMAEARALGGNQTATLLDVTQRYNEFVSSGQLPTPEEFAEAQTESVDTGLIEPGSLYSQMVRLSNSVSCEINN